jgi:O-antigen/teichoic acid export membrane protein
MRMAMRRDEQSFLGKLISNTAIAFGGTVAVRALSFATTLVLARGLGTESFGTYSYVGAYVFLFAFISDLGFEQVLTREISGRPHRASEIMGDALLLKLALSGVALIASIAIAYQLQMSEETRYCIVISACGLPLSVVVVFRSYLQSRYEIKYNFLVALPGGAAFLLAAIATVRLHLPLHMLFYAALGVGLLTLLGFLWVLLPRLQIVVRPRWSDMKALLRNSVEVGVLALLVAISMRFDQLLLFYLRSVNDVGVYAAAVRITDALAIVPYALLQTVFPLLTTERTAAERFHHTYRLSCKYLAALIMPIALALTVARREFTAAVFGPGYGAGADALAILAWNMFFGYTGSVYLNLFVAQARQRSAVLVTLLSVIVNLACNFAWIPHHGATGAAAATLVASAVSFVSWCMLPATRPYMLVCMRETWRAVLASAVAVGVPWLLGLSGIAGALAVSVTYLVALWRLGGVAWTDVALVQRLFAEDEVPAA